MIPLIIALLLAALQAFGISVNFRLGVLLLSLACFCFVDLVRRIGSVFLKRVLYCCLAIGFILTVRWARTALAPTYLYVVPTHELVDAERRAFFIRGVGRVGLDHVTVAVSDNKSPQVGPTRFDFPEIRPDHENPLAPHYFWITPSSPWNESYSITITSANGPNVLQNLVVRDVHRELQFASEINVDGKAKVSCRDSLVPTEYSVASNAETSCSDLMDVQVDWRMLEPSPFNYEDPAGDLVILKRRALPAPKDMEAQSETRHLTEYQKATILSEIRPYQGTKLLIRSTAGTYTRSYAADFYELFSSSAHWTVQRPEVLTAHYDSMIDVWVSRDNVDVPRPAVTALLDALEKSGVKHRDQPILDPDVPPNAIVLWVGAKSPDDVSPNQCAPVSFRLIPSEPVPCLLIDQTRKPVPFVPE